MKGGDGRGYTRRGCRGMSTGSGSVCMYVPYVGDDE